MLIKLPNGLLDGADLFNFAEIDELRGKQQNYLVDKDLVINNIGHVPKILEEMILALQTAQGLKWQGKMSEAIWKLPAGDLETLLVRIRQNTYGPRFYHEADCSHCGHVNKNLRVDLDTLEINEMPVEEMVKPKVVKLPKSGKEAELKAIYLRDLFDVIKIASSKKDSLITSVITTSLKRLDQKSPLKSEDIESIPVMDLIHLQDKIKETRLEGDIDTELEITCQNCNKDFKAKVNVFDSSFFDPTKGSTN